jgi:hypothetical protein
MRVVGSLCTLLLLIFATVFMAYGQHEPTLPATPLPTLPTATLALLETSVPTSVTIPTEVATIYDELVDKAGFQHPKLMMVAEMFTKYQVREIISESSVSKTTFENVEYTFVMFPALTGSGLLLFANENGNISLVMENTMFIRNLMGIADRNGNGLPDFSYYIQDVGNCCPGRLFAFDIDKNLNTIDIIPGRYAQEWIDIDNDGTFDIKGISWITPLDSYSDKVKIPHPHYVLLLTRWYAWNGTAYVDNSAEQIDFYQTEITGLRRKLAHSGCALYDALTLHQILLDYYAMGRLQEGWQELKPTLGMSRCPSDGDTAMLLNTFQRMVDNNQPWNNGIQTP